jgi:cell division protein FtsZ
MAIMGIGIASGDNRAIEAAERAFSHPLLEDVSIRGAKGVLMNITSSCDLTMEEMTQASERIYDEVGEDAEIIWGTAVDDSLGSDLRVTVIATGIGGPVKSTKVERPLELTLRGKVRDLTPADLQNAVEYDEPTFIRKRVAGESGGSAYRGFKGIIMDNNDLDVPTFLRRKAD